VRTEEGQTDEVATTGETGEVELRTDEVVYTGLGTVSVV
jgi:hypothetical protein